MFTQRLFDGKASLTRAFLCIASLFWIGGLIGPVSSAVPASKLDPSFGEGGIARYDNPDVISARSLISSGGSILAFANLMEDSFCQETVLGKLRLDGSSYSGFGSDGVLVSDGCESMTAIEPLQSGGYILAGPESEGSSCLSFRKLSSSGLTASGWPSDTPSGGRRVCLPASVSAGPSSVSDLLIDPQGRILASGGNVHTPRRTLGFLTRVTRDGTLDRTFGKQGRFRSADPGFLTFFGRGDHYNNVAAIRPFGNGRTLVAGSRSGAIAVAAVTSKGQPANRFGNRGLKMVNPDGHHCEGHRRNRKICLATDANDMTRDRKGRVLVLGTMTLWPGYDVVRKNRPVLARLTIKGQPDYRFGHRGIVKPKIGHFEGRSVAVQRDGRIVVGGTSKGKLVVFRLHPDGTMDRSFFTDGRLTAEDLTGGETSARDVVIDRHGRILILSDIQFGGYEVIQIKL